MPQKTRRESHQKIVDDTIILTRPRRGARPREEVWQTKDGMVTKYNLAYINHLVCRVDNGRVLGYDNNHGGHHRHFMGTVTPIAFPGYASLAKRVQAEVHKLWALEAGKSGRTEDEKYS